MARELLLLFYFHDVIILQTLPSLFLSLSLSRHSLYLLLTFPLILMFHSFLFSDSHSVKHTGSSDCSQKCCDTQPKYTNVHLQLHNIVPKYNYGITLMMYKEKKGIQKQKVWERESLIFVSLWSLLLFSLSF